MRAGKMRHRVTIQREATDADGSPSVTDGMGGKRLQWVDVATVWASIEPMAGKERLFAAQLEAGTTHRVRMRYYAGLTQSNALLFGSRRFNIRSIALTNEILHEMVLDCEEGVAQ